MSVWEEFITRKEKWRENKVCLNVSLRDMVLEFKHLSVVPILFSLLVFHNFAKGIIVKSDTDFQAICASLENTGDWWYW